MPFSRGVYEAQASAPSDGEPLVKACSYSCVADARGEPSDIPGLDQVVEVRIEMETGSEYVFRVSNRRAYEKITAELESINAGGGKFENVDDRNMKIEVAEDMRRAIAAAFDAEDLAHFAEPFGSEEVRRYETSEGFVDCFLAIRLDFTRRCKPGDVMPTHSLVFDDYFQVPYVVRCQPDPKVVQYPCLQKIDLDVIGACEWDAERTPSI